MNEAVDAPRLSRNRAALITVAVLSLCGALIGALWSFAAPAINAVIALTRSGERIRAYVGNDADHFFTAAYMLTGMVLVLAVVGAVAVWQWRAHRGPVLAAALMLGCVGAAGAAAGVGAALARLRYGSVDVGSAPVTPEHRVHYALEAPSVFFGHNPLQIATTVLFPAAVAALIYGVCAVSTSRDDLGAWPPEDVIDRTPTVDGVLPVGPSSPSH